MVSKVYTVRIVSLLLVVGYHSFTRFCCLYQDVQLRICIRNHFVESELISLVLWNILGEILHEQCPKTDETTTMLQCFGELRRLINSNIPISKM